MRDNVSHERTDIDTEGASEVTDKVKVIQDLAEEAGVSPPEGELGEEECILYVGALLKSERNRDGSNRPGETRWWLDIANADIY